MRGCSFPRPAQGGGGVCPEAGRAYLAPNLVYLDGLNPDARYRIEELDGEFYGDELMHAGIALPWMGDFQSASFTLEQVEE